MVKRSHALLVGWTALWLSGCAVSPPPIPIRDEPGLLVDIAYDPHAGEGHSHPASVSQDQLAIVLRGLQLERRDVTGTFGVLSHARGAPAFSDRETTVLIPLLASGLSKASPRDLVRFYLVQPDEQRNPLVTSGGIFVRNQHLYVILANARTSPSSVQYETPYEPNSRLNPLVPIARFKFKTSFSPVDWQIATHQAKKVDSWDGYLDESKVVVVDLALLAQNGLPAGLDKAMSKP